MFSFKLSLIFALTAVVAATPAPTKTFKTNATATPISAYTLDMPQWELEITPGRITVFEGTIQEAVAQAIAMEPSFEATFKQAVGTAAESAFKTPTEDTSYLICDHRSLEWDPAQSDEIDQGVMYLRSVKRRPHLRGKSCSRVSCSYGSAIFLCNDKNYERTFSTWNGVADSANHIRVMCKRTNGVYDPRKNGQIVWVLGQNFERDGWNTVVRRSNC